MIPQNDYDITELETIETSKTYGMNLTEKVINGYIDNIESVKQAIYKILNTERYKYLAYSWNYGIELENLIGEDVTFVCPELKRTITEALIQDERIREVTEFEFDTSQKGKVLTKFTVKTIFGDIAFEKEVKI